MCVCDGEREGHNIRKMRINILKTDKNEISRETEVLKEKKIEEREGGETDKTERRR
jgi:hypothetical protein